MPMKTVPIELDKPRRLRFDVNALADAEQSLGMGLGKILGEEASFWLIRTLLWAGLKWEDRRLTPEKAGAILTEYLSEKDGDLEAVATTVMEAVMASGLFGEVGEDSEDDPNAEAEAAK